MGYVKNLYVLYIKMFILCIYYLYLFYVATPHNNSFQKRKVVFQRNTFQKTRFDENFSHSLLNDDNVEPMGSSMQTSGGSSVGKVLAAMHQQRLPLRDITTSNITHKLITVFCYKVYLFHHMY